MDEFAARKLPYSAEAEQSVLGCILIAPDKFGEITGIVSSDDFYLEEHQQIYLAMQDLFLQSRDIDLVTLVETMVQRGISGDAEEAAGKKEVASAEPRKDEEKISGTAASAVSDGKSSAETPEV